MATDQPNSASVWSPSAAQPGLVKTMSVQPPRGGTHVAATGEIGKVEVVKIEKKGRHNRRVVVAFAGA